MQIVVLGMHRSGTSALCGLLNLAGVYFGHEGEFIQANEENPKGFWERKDVRHLNDKILYALGCDWSEISQLEKANLTAEIQSSFQAEAKSIVDKMQEVTPTGVIGLKEPRFCLLMDFWSSVLCPERFYILLQRNPEEIAISLKTRNNIPVEVANYLTEKYLGNAISAVQMESCHIVSFAQMISNPNSVLKAVIDSFEKSTGIRLKSPKRKDVESFISSRLYRSKSKGKPYSASDQLLNWNKALSKGNLPELKSFHQKVPGHVLSYEHANRFSEFIKVDVRFRRLEKDYFSVKEKLTNKHKLEQVVLQRDAQVADLEQVALQRDAQVADLEQVTLQRDAQVADLEKVALQRDAQVADLEKGALRRDAQVADLEQVALQRDAQVADLEQVALQRDAQVADLEKAAQQRDAQVADLEKVALQRDAQVADLEKVALQRDAQVADLEKVALQRDARITKLQSELVFSKATTRDTLKLRNQLLDRLNTLQVSTFVQFARPMLFFEAKWPTYFRAIGLLPKLFWWTLTLCLREKWRLHRQANMLLTTRLFDLSWYIQHNSDVVLEGVDPVSHWLTLGWQEGRDPNPFFNTSWYLELNPDVADAGENPLMHYLSHGAFEGRDPHPLFNSDWYLEQNPDVAKVGVNPLVHYLSYGASEGRSILPSRKKRVPVRQYDTFDAELERTTRKDLGDCYTASDVVRNRLVSIIMPTYNRAGLITAAINSVVEQTHKNWELLILDDGSDDETSMVVGNFSDDVRIKYIKKEHGGVCQARNAGLDLAQGERVAFLDSDNLWDSEFLALLLAAIEINNIEIAYCGLRLQQNGRIVGYRGDVFDYSECLKINYVDLNALLFRRSVIGDFRFDESIRRMNDWDFLLLVAVKRNVEYFAFVGVSYSFNERADQISVLEPEVYKKLIQERHKNHQANTPPMTMRSAFAKLQLDVAIMTATPKEMSNECGDYQYATDLAQALKRRGHKPRLYDDQEHVEGAPPDITISLRGPSEHEFMVGTIKVIWSISHPDLLTWQQIDDCDLLFCASLTWPQMLYWAGKSNVFSLLPCTDQTRFFPQPDVSEQNGRVLFVGNSRNPDWSIVRHVVEAGVNVHIYGTNWKDKVPKSMFKGDYIPNERLNEEYAAASVVLNDHLPSMKDFGYLSSRIFDVTAAGSVIVSDHVPGIHHVFGDAVCTFRAGTDFSSVLEKSMALSGRVDRIALGNWVNENHTFDIRADDILCRVEEFALAKRSEAIRTVHCKPSVALLGDVKSLRVGLIPQGYGASMTSSAYIRLVQPLTFELDGLTVDLKHLNQRENLRDLDVVIVSRTAFDSLKYAEEFLERSARQGTRVVIDVDDAFHSMDESHPQFTEYQSKIDALNLVLESADEIWCSTTPLQDSLESRFGPSILVPNSLDPRLWRSYRDFRTLPEREDNDCLELLYAGSFTHGRDLEMVMPVLDQLEKAVPIRLTVIGIAPNFSPRPWIRRLAPGIDSIYPRFVPWLRSHASLFDVGIAPLTGNSFNQFKSDLKILEYRAMGLVPVASAIQPYLDSNAIENQTLCSDPEKWRDRLLSLASDRGALDQQKKLVDAESNYIWEKRSAFETGNRLAKRLCGLVDHSC